ncbi:uncharacterized protein MELLADRAFT_66748 [Melampsora larici-populina 98AG31]|uniref:Uncharacterized protein n=1 Tax=Melampsora larici-populina (strain 98AG31 / pathotype 3-4-7) TaxID=747676 RepID=F4S0F3_MELLP|nr:uncharacterized protein MELLADRAFT_66748 [Melampsora larici-populina 98AG31]EGG01754.1 hypothetical protein MELLADRAFT_66748 [Melampsora larici-populina 98AG31]
MSLDLEDLQRKIDETFKELEVAMQRETAESKAIEEGTNNKELPVSKGLDYPEIATKVRQVNLAVEPSSSEKSGKACMPFNNLIFGEPLVMECCQGKKNKLMKQLGCPDPAMFSVLVFILSTWAFVRLWTLAVTFPSENHTKPQSSTYYIPVF